jgi:hypothetical protein
MKRLQKDMPRKLNDLRLTGVSTVAAAHAGCRGIRAGEGHEVTEGLHRRHAKKQDRRGRNWTGLRNSVSSERFQRAQCDEVSVGGKTL